MNDLKSFAMMLLRQNPNIMNNPQPCYPVQNPYASANWGNGCGCGNACGC